MPALLNLLLCCDCVAKKIGDLLLEPKHSFAGFFIIRDLLQRQYSFASAVNGFQKVALHLWVIRDISPWCQMVNELSPQALKMKESVIP